MKTNLTFIVILYYTIFRKEYVNVIDILSKLTIGKVSIMLYGGIAIYK